jgi:hypothetical protein
MVAKSNPKEQTSRTAVDPPPADLTRLIKAMARMMARRDHDANEGTAFHNEADSSTDKTDKEPK